MTCPACGASNPAGNAYCGSCGAALMPPTVPPIACWSCRAPNPPGRAYCGQCGQPLAAAPAAEAARVDGRSNGVLVALLVVAVAALGIVIGFLLLTRGDGGASGAEGPSATPTTLASPSATPWPEVTPLPGSTPTSRVEPTLPTVPSLGPPAEFACHSRMSVDGPIGTSWDLVRVHFRTQRGFDRVIYELRLRERTDDDLRPDIAVGQSIPGQGVFVGEPTPDPGADARINVVLANGVRDRVRLRDGYRPSGMRIVERLWTQRYRSHVNYSPPEDDPRMAGVGVLSNIDVIGDGCLALRVLGWDGPGDETVWAFVDIQRGTPSTNPLPGGTPRPSNGPPSLGGPVPGPPTSYTCGPVPSTVLADRDDSRYRLYEVGFQTFRDYERVVFRLRRTGTGSGPPLAEARLLEPEALDTDALPAGVAAAVAMRLEGVSDGARLDGYQPRGMSIVEMVYTTGRDDTTYPNVLLSSEGCYQLRVPAWESNGLGIDREQVDVFIDFER